MTTIFVPTTFNKPATAVDGTGEGGPTVSIVRDTTGLSGGTPGFVNCAFRSYTIAGKNLKQFEWNGLFVLDNYSDFGENCAGYFQANSFGNGSTFGLVSEVCSTNPASIAQLTGFESDAWVSGAITPASKHRIVNDVVFGDGQFIRKISTAASPAEVHYGQRVAASGDTPWARAIVGQFVTDFKEVGQILKAPPEGAVRGYFPEGKITVLFDSTRVIGQTMWRMKEGQEISFDEYDQIKLRRSGRRMELRNGGVPFFSVDIDTGDIYKKGVKVL